MATERRGSEALLERLGQGCAFDETVLRKVVDAVGELDVEVVGWWCRGQPRPDFYSGTVRVSAGRVGEVVQRLADLRAGSAIGLELFPIGIPWPEWFHVNFKSGGQGV